MMARCRKPRSPPESICSAATAAKTLDDAPTMRQSLTPSERAMRARMAAYMLHARHDPRETTKVARVAFSQRFVDQVDPDRRLPDHDATAAPKRRRAYSSPGSRICR